MKKIAIYGAGGFGREIACLIRTINNEHKEWDFVGFFDDNHSLSGTMISHFGPCLGGIDALNSFPDHDLHLVVAIGNVNSVRSIHEHIDRQDIHFPNIIHPSLTLPDPGSFRIGEGNIIQANCTFSCDVTVGDFNVFNGSIVLGHDVSVGSYNQFMPSVRVSGEVSIGDDNFFGVGSIILQGQRIGRRVRLGAGSVMISKPKDGCLYVGNPARLIEI